MSTIKKLQISRKKFLTIYAKDENEVKIIDELNRDYYRFEKSEQRLRAKTISCDRLYDDYNYEIKSNDNDPYETLVTEYKNKALYEAINSLEEIERKIVMLYAVNEDSFNCIAKKLKLSKTTIIKKYHNSINKLKELMKDYK